MTDIGRENHCLCNTHLGNVNELNAVMGDPLAPSLMKQATSFTIGHLWGMSYQHVMNSGKPMSLHPTRHRLRDLNWPLTCSARSFDRTIRTKAGGGNTLLTWNCKGCLKAFIPVGNGYLQNVVMLTLIGTWGCKEIHLQLTPKLKCHSSCMMGKMPFQNQSLPWQIFSFHIGIDRYVCWNELYDAYWPDSNKVD